MGNAGDGQKAGERAEHAWAPPVLQHLEILEANSAAWEFFKLSLMHQLTLYFFHVVHSVHGECGSLLSFAAQHSSSRGKAGPCITHFLNIFSNTAILIRKQHIHGHVYA